MANYFGINSNYDFFGNASGSSILSDYGLIRSGAYKKLMNAYYGKDSNTSSENSSVNEETETTEKAEKLNLRTVKDTAWELRKSAQELRYTNLFEGTVNEETGKKEYDQEKIKKLVNSFVEDYNNTIEAAGDSDTNAILRKTIWMINDVKANDSLLENVGITIGTDNKLSLNESKLAEADMNKLKTLFNGSNSLAGKIDSKSADLNRYAGTELNLRPKTSVSYTAKGDYTSLGKNSIINTYF